MEINSCHKSKAAQKYVVSRPLYYYSLNNPHTQRGTASYTTLEHNVVDDDDDDDDDDNKQAMS